MEEPLVPLSPDESKMDSPTWHQEALEETIARCEAGQERPIDWTDAKQQLRKRAE